MPARRGSCFPKFSLSADNLSDCQVGRDGSRDDEVAVMARSQLDPDCYAAHTSGSYLNANLMSGPLKMNMERSSLDLFVFPPPLNKSTFSAPPHQFVSFIDSLKMGTWAWFIRTARAQVLILKTLEIR